MKRLINQLLIWFFLICNLNLSAQTEEERILQFHSDIHILKNCRIHVSEHIRIVVRNERIRHGILRDLPLIYPYKGGTVSYDFKLSEVLRDGESESFHVENMSNGIRIYIGDQDVILDTGVYEYTINYTINHALGIFDNVDELSWNVNGTGWSFPVEQLSATIYWPSNARLKQYAAYIGFYGSKKTEYSARKLPSGISFKANRPLSAGENMTVSIGLKKERIGLSVNQ